MAAVFATTVEFRRRVGDVGVGRARSCEARMVNENPIAMRDVEGKFCRESIWIVQGSPKSKWLLHIQELFHGSDV